MRVEKIIVELSHCQLACKI